MENNEITILQQIEIEGLKVSELKKKNEKQIEVCKKMINYYTSIINNNEKEIKAKEDEYYKLVESNIKDLDPHETDCYLNVETPTFKIRYTKPKKDIALKDINIEEIPEKFQRIKKELNLRKLKLETEIKNGNVIDIETGEIIDFTCVIEKPGYYKMERKI